MAVSEATSLLWKLQSLKKKLGITSWIEMGLIGATLYLCLTYILSLLGLTPPMTGLIGLAALSFCTYQVFLLSSLSERIEEYAKQNKELEKTNKNLSANVDTFTKQNGELKKITDGLSAENERFKGQITHLSGTLENLEVVKQTMESFGDEEKSELGDVLGGLQDAINGQKEVVMRQEGILQSTEEATSTQEKALLLTLHSQCQFLDKNMGMSQKEFETFLTMIPEKFRKASLSFESLDQDNSGFIDIQEFQSAVDDLVKAN